MNRSKCNAVGDMYKQIDNKRMENTENRHYAVIDAYTRKLTLLYNDTLLAESTNAFILKEVGKSVYNPVLYVPKEDIMMELAKENGRESFCPIKGDATYWNLTDNPVTNDYFAWSYEEPLPRAKKIKGCVAFNLNYIKLISEVNG